MDSTKDFPSSFRSVPPTRPPPSGSPPLSRLPPASSTPPPLPLSSLSFISLPSGSFSSPRFQTSSLPPAPPLPPPHSISSNFPPSHHSFHSPYSHGLPGRFPTRPPRRPAQVFRSVQHPRAPRTAGGEEFLFTRGGATEEGEVANASTGRHQKSSGGRSGADFSPTTGRSISSFSYRAPSSPPSSCTTNPSSTSTSSSRGNRSRCASCFSCISTFSSELSHIKETIIEGGNTLFGKWGSVVYRYPYTVIGCALLFASICAIGFIPGIPKWMDGAENLYSLPYSVARDHRTLHTAFFGDTAIRRNAVILTNRLNPGGNVLTWGLLEEVKRIDGVVRGTDIDPEGRMIRMQRSMLDGHNDYFNTTNPAIREGNDPALVAMESTGMKGNRTRYSGKTESDDDLESAVILDRSEYLTFEDICARNPWHQCSADSILNMGLLDWKALLGREDPLIPVFNGLVVNPMTKSFFVPEYYLGGTDLHDCVLELPNQVVEQLVDNDKVLGAGSKVGYKECQVQCITEVEAFLLTYDEDDKVIYQHRNDLWEELFINTLEANQNAFRLRISLQAFRSRDDELKASTGESNDVVFVVLTFVILISYSSALNFSCDLYRSRSYPALAGAGAAMLGLLSGMGLVSMCQVAMVPTVLICPFLVMGIGVDDMFVIINSYSLSYMVASAEDRCVVSLRDSGLSITITTTTNLIAFAVGAFSPYLSIKNFCIYSAASLGLGYLYVLTFFFAFLCLDAKREESAKVCFFCLPSKASKQQERKRSATGEEYGGSYGQEEDAAAIAAANNTLQQISTYSLVTYKVKVSADEKKSIKLNRKAKSSNERILPSSKVPTGSGRGAELSSFSFTDVPTEPRLKGVISTSSLSNALTTYDPVLARQAVFEEPRGNVGRKWRLMFLNYYGPFLMRTPVKIIVLIAFSVFLGVSIYGFTNLEQGLNLTELAPDNSYLRFFDADVDKYFSKFDAPVDIFFPDRTNWWEPQVHSSIRELTAKLQAREANKMTVNPMVKLLDDAQYGPKLKSGNKKTFERTLYEALSDPQSPYKQFEYDFIWEGSELYSWRFKVLPAYMRTSEERATWMKEIRGDAASHMMADVPLTTVAYNFMMIFYESDLEILNSVVVNMTVAAIAMLLVAFVLIPQFAAGLLVILIMLLIDVGLFGFMYFWDVKLNMVSMINLVISIGFAVDYSAHLCHTFTHCEGNTRNFRVIESLVLMGNPVLHGAASTLLGVFMLGFSSSYVFKVFFKMMVMVIVFGSLHGVVLLPVLLSLVGQMGGHGHGDKGDGKEAGGECFEDSPTAAAIAGGGGGGESKSVIEMEEEEVYNTIKNTPKTFGGGSTYSDDKQEGGSGLFHGRSSRHYTNGINNQTLVLTPSGKPISYNQYSPNVRLQSVGNKLPSGEGTLPLQPPRVPLPSTTYSSEKENNPYYLTGPSSMRSSSSNSSGITNSTTTSLIGSSTSSSGANNRMDAALYSPQRRRPAPHHPHYPWTERRGPSPRTFLSSGNNGYEMENWRETPKVASHSAHSNRSGGGSRSSSCFINRGGTGRGSGNSSKLNTNRCQLYDLHSSNENQMSSDMFASVPHMHMFPRRPCATGPGNLGGGLPGSSSSSSQYTLHPLSAYPLATSGSVDLPTCYDGNDINTTSRMCGTPALLPVSPRRRNVGPPSSSRRTSDDGNRRDMRVEHSGTISGR